ncbi:MAG: hypothetical protein LUI87_10060 [Lachnospiraceae bacterium]|nr:hypothetical protein [Lachnospiraceae bacterium]
MERQKELSPERKEFINSPLQHYQPSDAQDVQAMLKNRMNIPGYQPESRYPSMGQNTQQAKKSGLSPLFCLLRNWKLIQASFRRNISRF